MDKNKKNDIQNNDVLYDNNMNNNSMYYMNDVNSNRYNNRYDSRFDRRYDNYYNYDRRYDRDYYDRMRYYQYPYCDRYGRCENPIWWMFWPLFFQ